MKLFIASHSRETARVLMTKLVQAGHEVTARWITQDNRFHQGLNAYTDEERKSIAVMDEEDIRAADGLVLIAEPDGQYVPGGKHVETGIALALGRSIFLIGRRENIFHWHPRVQAYPDAEAFLESLNLIPLPAKS